LPGRSAPDQVFALALDRIGVEIDGGGCTLRHVLPVFNTLDGTVPPNGTESKDGSDNHTARATDLCLSDSTARSSTFCNAAPRAKSGKTGVPARTAAINLS
jgi:hypothetical protein